MRCLVPAPNAAVGGRVHDVGRVGEPVDDVGRQTSDELAVAELAVEWVEHLHAGRASTVAGETDDELVVVGVHGVEFGVKRAGNGGERSGLRVQQEHAAWAGCNEQVAAVEMEVAGHRVTR